MIVKDILTYTGNSRYVCLDTHVERAINQDTLLLVKENITTVCSVVKQQSYDDGILQAHKTKYTTPVEEKKK